MSNVPTRNRAPWPETPVAALAIIGALAYLWFGWCVFPLSHWNEVRLAPTFALREGIAVYPPPNGGPLGTWIYGPLPIVLNLPATLAASPEVAVLIAGAINLLTLVLPLVLLCTFVPEWPERLTALATCVLLLPAHALGFQVADHTAIAFGLLGCWWLVRNAVPSRGELAAAAACAVLAVSAKQTSLFVLFAQCLYLGLAGKRTLIWQYVVWAVFFGTLAVFAGVAWFGLSEIWFNLVQIPARLPWGDFSAKVVSRWPQLTAYVLLPIVLLGAARRSRHWPDHSSCTGRLVHCTAIVFLVLLPMGIAAFLKIGGDLNVLNSSFYLVPAAVVAVFGSLRRSRLPVWASAIIVGSAFACRIPEYVNLPGAPLTQSLVEAGRLARVEPGTAWFPVNPLATYYSDGLLYHVDDGLATRFLAGVGITESGFRSYLPCELKTVIIPTACGSSLGLQLLSDYNSVTKLAGWTLFQRPNPVAP